MIHKKVFNYLFIILNIIISIILIGYTIYNTKLLLKFLPRAENSALHSLNLKPNPLDYLWKINILKQQPVEPNKIALYAGYYNYFLKIYPSFTELYSLLGYCYYYLGEEERSVKFLKKAIEYNPVFFWNYYNLAMLEISHHHYDDAENLLIKASTLNLAQTLYSIKASNNVYYPLVQQDNLSEKEIFVALMTHLQEKYQKGLTLLTVLQYAKQKGNQDAVFRIFKPEIYAF